MAKKEKRPGENEAGASKKDNWRESEYEALRQEILVLTEAQQSAVRFYLPAAAAIFAVPYLTQRTSQALLWSLCAGGSGLMIMAMGYTLLSYVQGLFKIGTYIRSAIESHSDAGLRWESFLFESQIRKKTPWPSEHVVITLGAIAANIAASLGVGHVFVPETQAGLPVIAAGCFSLFTIPAIYRMWRSGREREMHAYEVETILMSLEEKQRKYRAPVAAG